MAKQNYYRNGFLEDDTFNTYNMDELNGKINGKVVHLTNTYGIINPDRKLPGDFKKKTVFFHISVVEGKNVIPHSRVCLKLNLKSFEKPKAVWVKDLSNDAMEKQSVRQKPDKIKSYCSQDFDGLLYGSVTCVKKGFGFVKPDLALPHPYSSKKDIYFSSDSTNMDEVCVGQRAAFQVKKDQVDRPAVSQIVFFYDSDEMSILQPQLHAKCGHICFTYAGRGGDTCAEKCSHSLSCGHSCPRICSDPCPKICDECYLIQTEAAKMFQGYTKNMKSVLLGSITYVGEEHGYIKPCNPLPNQVNKKNGVYFTFEEEKAGNIEKGSRVAFTLKQVMPEKPAAENLAIVKDIFEDEVVLQLITQVYKSKSARKPQPGDSNPVDKLEIEATKGSSNALQKHQLLARRQFDAGNPLDLNFRIAESQFLRLAQKAGKQYEIESVDYFINPTLVRRFRAKCSEFEKTYGKGSSSSHVLAFHGTEAYNIGSIVRENFKMEFCQRSLYGQGIYLSEFPHVSIDFGRSLLLCKVLPGRSCDVNDSRTGASIAHGYNSHRVRADKDGYGWALVVNNPDQILPCYVINYKVGSVGTSSTPVQPRVSLNLGQRSYSQAASFHVAPPRPRHVPMHPSPAPTPQRPPPPETKSDCVIL